MLILLVILTGVVNIIIYLKLKNDVSSYFNLIEKSDNLYQNLLFSVTVIKELINSHIFEVIIFLSTKVKGELKEVYKLNKKNLQYEKYNEG